MKEDSLGRKFKDRKGPMNAGMPVTQFTDRILSMFKHTRTPKRCTAWNDAQYFMAVDRAPVLGHTDYGAAWSTEGARGLHATDPASCTKLDYAIMFAQRMIASKLEKDDWVAAQELASIDKIIGDCMLIIILTYQKEWIDVLPSSPQDSALAADELRWETDGYYNIVNWIQRDGYNIHPLSLKLAQKYCVKWKYEVAYPFKSMPGGYWYPHIGSSTDNPRTLTAVRQLYLKLKGVTPLAELHWKRIKQSTVALNESMFKVRELVPTSEECIWYKCGQYIYTQDGGATDGAIVGSFQTAAGVATYTNIHIWAKDGEAPSDYWALVDLLWGINSATHEYCMIGTGADPANNSTMNTLNASYAQTTVPTKYLSMTTINLFLPEMPQFLAVVDNWSYTAGGGAVAVNPDVYTYLLDHLGRDYQWVEGKLDAAEFDALLFSAIAKMFQGDIQF